MTRFLGIIALSFVIAAICTALGASVIHFAGTLGVTP